MKSLIIYLLLLCLLTLTGCVRVTTSLYTPAPSMPFTIHSMPSPTSVPVVPLTFTYQPPPVVLAVTLPPPLPQPLDAHEVACLSEALYYEARGESERGQIAVAYVITNRMEDSRFPDSACGVVHQGPTRHGRIVRNRCQFAYYCDGLSETPKNKAVYNRSVELAKLVLLKVAPNPIGKSLFFHGRLAKKSRPSRYATTKTIGNHFFYSYRDSYADV